MFTGIIEELGTVEAVSGPSLSVSARNVIEDTRLGDSISVNGACLTVTAMTSGSLSFDVMTETLRRSNLGSLRRGRRVNLERALILASRIGGHLVQGHVDATGEIVFRTREGNATLITIAAPENVSSYLVEKGFIAVDGISLTIVACQGRNFTVSIVETTLKNTTMGLAMQGHRVNLEVDIVARYVERFARAKASGLTQEMLSDLGFCAPAGK